MKDQSKISEPCAGFSALDSQGLCPVDPKAKKPRKRHPNSRNHTVAIKYTAAELAALDDRSGSAELPRAEYIRAKSLDVSRTSKDRSPSVDRQLLSRCMSELGEATRPLQRIAEAAEAGDNRLPKGQIELALTRIQSVAEAMLCALGVDIP